MVTLAFLSGLVANAAVAVGSRPSALHTGALHTTAAPNSDRARLVAVAGSKVAGSGTAYISASGAKCNQARASHILVDTEELIDTIRDQVEDGMPFGQIAETVSLCTSRSRRGSLGWFSAGMMTPEFEEACFQGKVGSLIKVHTNFGWHLIRLEDKRSAPVDMEPLVLRDRISSGQASSVQIVDVRNAAELELAALPGVEVINLPFNEYGEWGERVVAGEILDPEKETVVLCHHGMRSKRTAQFLLQNGYEHVTFLKGGLDAYAEEADPAVGRYQNEMKGEECGTCG